MGFTGDVALVAHMAEAQAPVARAAEEEVMIPVGTLRLECQMINPPKPSAFHVRVDGQSVAILTIEEVERAYHQYQAALSKRTIPVYKATED